MTRKILSVVLSIILGLFGILSSCAAFFFPSLDEVMRIAGIVNGGFLMIGAWLLFRQSMSAVLWFSLSAILYFLIVMYDRYTTDGTIAITGFIADFYWSLGLRGLLVVAAYFLLRRDTKMPVQQTMKT